MTTILHEPDADPGAIEGSRVAVVGYGNQGRSWALNLRDSGLDTVVCVRADETRARAEADGFTPAELDASSDADIVCLLVPDDVIPTIPLTPRDDALVVVASGYTLAFDRLDPPCDVGMVAPAHARARGAQLLRGRRRASSPPSACTATPPAARATGRSPSPPPSVGSARAPSR